MDHFGKIDFGQHWSTEQKNEKTYLLQPIYFRNDMNISCSFEMGQNI